MREVYESDISSAKTIPSLMVLAFDYAQNVEIPHDPLQPGKFYYMSPLKCYQFGIVNEGNGTQVHYLYSEGTGAKGADEVVSLLWKKLQSIDRNQVRNLRLWADNYPVKTKTTL
jgi:hypothetical protein